jgi:hypothetical protein
VFLTGQNYQISKAKVAGTVNVDTPAPPLEVKHQPLETVLNPHSMRFTLSGM